MRAVWLAGAVALGGCDGSEACADFSDGVLMTALLTDNGETARVEVELRRSALGEASIPVKMCRDASLRVDDVELVGVKRPNGAVVYEGELPEVAAEAPHTRRFALTSDGATVERTARIAATGFEISSPAADAEVSRASALAIGWTPARGGEDTMIVQVADAIDGDACLGAPVELEEPDDGEATLAAAEVEAAEAHKQASAVCEAVVTLSRRQSVPLAGEGEAVFDPDSRVLATTSRTRSFVSVP
jgi:hypothetical protein